MTQSPIKPSAGEEKTPPADSVAAEGQPDPLLHLHKMSYIAGVGTVDYVAVNTTAVVAAIFGVASMLAMIGTVLLIIPVIGVVLSIIALRQIKNSNGTQTGRGIAWFGLIASALITAGLFAYHATQYVHDRAGRAAIEAACTRYGEDLKSGNFDDAYKLFDDDFHQRVAIDPFKTHLGTIRHMPGVPPIKKIEWNGLAEFGTDPDSGQETAKTVLRVTFIGNDEEAREPATFKKVDGVWLIDALPNTFPVIKANGKLTDRQTNF